MMAMGLADVAKIGQAGVQERDTAGFKVAAHWSSDGHHAAAQADMPVPTFSPLMVAWSDFSAATQTLQFLACNVPVLSFHTVS